MSTELFAGPESPQYRRISADRRFRCPGYTATLDRKRLSVQIERIRAHMLRGGCQTLMDMEIRSELEKQCSQAIFPESSLSAQFRNLRRLGYVLQKRWRGRDRSAPCPRVWEYHLLPPQESAAG